MFGVKQEDEVGKRIKRIEKEVGKDLEVEREKGRKVKREKVRMERGGGRRRLNVKVKVEDEE